MRYVLLPIVGLTFTLATLSMSSPFVGPATAALSYERPNAKPSGGSPFRDEGSTKKKRKASSSSPPPDRLRPNVDPSRKATRYVVDLEGAVLPGVTVSTLSEKVQAVETHTNGALSLAPGRSIRTDVTLSGTGPIPLPVLDQWRAVEAGSPRRAGFIVRTYDSAGAVVYEHRATGIVPLELSTSPGKDKWSITFGVSGFELYLAG